jgi:hypothetical protein
MVLYIAKQVLMEVEWVAAVSSLWGTSIWIVVCGFNIYLKGPCYHFFHYISEHTKSKYTEMIVI